MPAARSRPTSELKRSGAQYSSRTLPASVASSTSLRVSLGRALFTYAAAMP